MCVNYLQYINASKNILRSITTRGTPRDTYEQNNPMIRDNLKKLLPKKKPKMMANPTFCGQENFNVEGNFFVPYKEIKYYILAIFFLP